jgi:hypothetical protein
LILSFEFKINFFMLMVSAWYFNKYNKVILYFLNWQKKEATFSSSLLILKNNRCINLLKMYK